MSRSQKCDNCCRRGPGRPRQYSVRILLPLSAEMLAAIDAARAPGQTRVDYIRAAIGQLTNSLVKISPDDPGPR